MVGGFLRELAARVTARIFGFQRLVPSDLVQPYMAGARFSDIIGSEDVEPGSLADYNPTRFKRDCSRARKVGFAVDRHRPVRSVDDVVGVGRPEAATKSSTSCPWHFCSLMSTF